MTDFRELVEAGGFKLQPENEKGPAESAISPSPCPKPHLHKETEMNIHTDITEKDDQAITSISIPSQRFAEIDNNTRLGLYEVFDTIGNVLCAYCNQDRFFQDAGTDSQTYNDAGEMLTELNEFFDWLKTRLVEVTAATPSDDPFENRKRLFIMLMKEVSYHDELEKCAAMASQAVYEQTALAAAKRREQRRADA